MKKGKLKIIHHEKFDLTTLAVSIFCRTPGLFAKNQVFAFSDCPGAEGKVTVKKDKNQNYKVQVNVMHLAPPQDLPTPAQTYVVWMESADNGVKNLGQLKSGSNLIKRVRTASLETVSSVKPTRIFITPENDATTEYPAGQEIITTGSL